MDPVFDKKCPPENILRYIKVGLLCVQELAADRPTMSEVLSMLTNDAVAITTPKTPAFSSLWTASEPITALNNLVRYSNNGVTLSVIDGR